MRARALVSLLLAAAVAVSGSAAVGSAQVAGAATVPASRTTVAAGALTAEVTAVVGKPWTATFRDRKRVAVRTAATGALRVQTAAGTATSTRVTAVEGDTATVATTDPAVTISVSVRRDRGGVIALSALAHGEGVEEVALDLAARPGERYLGLGERSTRAEHRGTMVQSRVLDGPYTSSQAPIIKGVVPAPGFSERRDATYFPIPWVLSTRGYGVLVDNDEDSWWELATKAHPDLARVRVEADRLDLRVFAGPKPTRALQRMTAAIGRQPLLDSPATHGAWWQPVGDAVAGLAQQREAGVPISIAQTYTHYLPCHDQETERERERTAALHEQGVAVTTYINPMICTDHPRYAEGVERGAYTLDADGEVLVYKYSTATSFQVAQIDFSAPEGRAFFHELLAEAVADGYDGWMEDFGEYTPDDAVSADGTPGPAMHNRYAADYHRVAHDFAAEQDRPLFRYVRSGWTGSAQHSPIVWGGDPTTVWDFDGLSSSVTQGLTMGASGVSVWGPDIGGFFSWFNATLSPELLTRWIEFGAFTGVMRLQSGGINIGGGARAQVTDPEVAPVWKRYTRLRTMLYPYIAAAQEQYAATGLPLMRQLALVLPRDKQAVAASDQYLFGPDLLVAPVVERGATSRSVYLPEGRWIDLGRTWRVADDGGLRWRKAAVQRGGRTVQAKAPLGRIPLFLRAGAVLPLLPKGVDTLSGYGEEYAERRLTDTTGRLLLAAPTRGRWAGALGEGEQLTSTATRRRWSLRIEAERPRDYHLRATLAGLPGFTPCGVTADGAEVDYRWRAKRRELVVRTPLAASGAVTVTGCPTPTPAALERDAPAADR